MAKAAAIREEQFVDRVAFLAHNVRGKYSLCLFLHCHPALFDFSMQLLQKQLAYPYLWTHRVKNVTRSGYE